MLYLAEVQKQKTGFMGAGKAELKLLACQRADQSWNPVPREEVISAPTEEANKFNDGALVLADLNVNRQVQRIQEAGRPIISILQNFSRQLEKSKSQEEKIEQWKQSLMYQSQEMNRRQAEMEERLERLQQMEEDFEQIQGQQAETQRLRLELERNSTELEGAWEHLRGEQRRLHDQQTDSQHLTVLDQDKACQMQELLAHLSSGIAPTQAVFEQLNLSFSLVNTQQEILTQHWQQLQQQREFTTGQQQKVDYQTQVLQSYFGAWQQSQNALEQDKVELKVQISALNNKQDYAQMLGLQLRQYEELYQQICNLVPTSCHINKVDLEALENMPLDQLQQLVQTYSSIMQKVSHFVHDQEEELRFQQQTIEELQANLQQATSDRATLETQLAEEKDRYQMLNETLVGQRRNLQEREDILNQHQRVLLKRQGNSKEDQKISLELILVQIERHKQQQSSELQNLEQQISSMRDRIQQIQGRIDHQAHEQEIKQQELQNLEQNLLSLQTETAQSWGRVNLYQEMLQPVQDSLDGLRQKLQALEGALVHVQKTGEYQLQTITQMQQIIN